MRKTVKRTLSMLLIVAMCMGLSIHAMSVGATGQNAVITATTSDFATATFDEAAYYLNELGLFGGVGTNEDGTTNYDLNRAPTRAEAITMLVRLLGKETEARAGNWTIPFTDVPQWALPYVGYAYANGLTGGISTTEFGSNHTATQAQYLTFILRAMGYQDGEDFVWDRAWELSDKLGLTDSTNRDNDFLRGDVAVISLKALVAEPKSGKNLASTLMDAGVFSVENAVTSNLIQSTATNITNMDASEIKKNGTTKYGTTNAFEDSGVSSITMTDKTEDEVADAPWGIDTGVDVEWEDTTTTYKAATLAPGAYDTNGVMLASWDELVNTYGLDIEQNYTYNTSGSMSYTLKNNAALENTTKVIIGDSVSKIGDNAFYSCSSLTSIEIPSSVTSIGLSAFSGCSALTSIEIPSSVASIGASAFSGCKALTSIQIPSSVTSIGKSAFSSCSKLTSIQIPSSVTSISDSAFLGCTSLTSITIPSSVTIINASAFKNCSKLTSIKIPDSVESIGCNTFANCTALKSVQISNTVTIIESNTFYNCTSLQSVQIPDNVSWIQDCAFYNCAALISVAIPNNVRTIDIQAFCLCTGLQSVQIPCSVTSIGNNAFGNCNALLDIYYAGTQIQWDQIDNHSIFDSATIHYNSTMPT